MSPAQCKEVATMLQDFQYYMSKDHTEYSLEDCQTRGDLYDLADKWIENFLTEHHPDAYKEL